MEVSLEQEMALSSTRGTLPILKRGRDIQWVAPATRPWATFTMDAVGNITKKHHQSLNPMTMVYDAGSRITTMQQGTVRTTYTYDDNGSMTVEQAGATRTTYSYDRENRMSVHFLGVDRTTYAYDGDGMRRSKQYVASGSTKKTTYLWDGADYLGEETV